MSPALAAACWLVAAPPDASADAVSPPPDEGLPADPRVWSAQERPKPGPPRAIGAHAGGCLRGGAPLPPDGPGYQAVRLERRRSFGHPSLVAYVRRLGAEVRRRRLGVLVVGDLAQPRGGPAPTGHRSHQSGLDVDLWYGYPEVALRRRLRPAERARLPAPVVVDLRAQALAPTWHGRMLRLLELAASDPAVDRVFVHPVVKRQLCGRAAGAPWLARVRPWYGHHDHFHVRLRCPEGEPECVAQEPIADAAGDAGCGEALAWWFTDEPRKTQEQRAQTEAGRGPPLLPLGCAEVLRP